MKTFTFFHKSFDATRERQNGVEIMTMMKAALFAAISAALAGGALAQSGPVATSCGSDIAKICANKPHDGSTRICLEQAYAKLSPGCKSALDNTGGGRGKSLGKGQGKGKAKAS